MKTKVVYPQLPDAPPSKGRSPIDFGNASCSPVINGSRVVIWNRTRRGSQKTTIFSLTEARPEQYRISCI